jgi:hypothetical protein
LNLPALVIPGANPTGAQPLATAPVAVAEEPYDYGKAEQAAVPDAPKPRSSTVAVEENDAPLMAVEAALDRIGETVLVDFKKQFNGKPTEMRHIDAKDRIFKNEEGS